MSSITKPSDYEARMAALVNKYAGIDLKDPDDDGSGTLDGKSNFSPNKLASLHEAPANRSPLHPALRVLQQRALEWENYNSHKKNFFEKIKTQLRGKQKQRFVAALEGKSFSNLDAEIKTLQAQRKETYESLYHSSKLDIDPIREFIKEEVRSSFSILGKKYDMNFAQFFSLQKEEVLIQLVDFCDFTTQDDKLLGQLRQMIDFQVYKNFRSGILPKLNQASVEDYIETNSELDEEGRELLAEKVCQVFKKRYRQIESPKTLIDYFLENPDIKLSLDAEHNVGTVSSPDIRLSKSANCEVHDELKTKLKLQDDDIAKLKVLFMYRPRMLPGKKVHLSQGFYDLLEDIFAGLNLEQFNQSLGTGRSKKKEALQAKFSPVLTYLKKIPGEQLEDMVKEYLAKGATTIVPKRAKPKTYKLDFHTILTKDKVCSPAAASRVLRNLKEKKNAGIIVANENAVFSVLKRVAESILGDHSMINYTGSGKEAADFLQDFSKFCKAENMVEYAPNFAKLKELINVKKYNLASLKSLVCLANLADGIRQKIVTEQDLLKKLKKTFLLCCSDEAFAGNNRLRNELWRIYLSNLELDGDLRTKLEDISLRFRTQMQKKQGGDCKFSVWETNKALDLVEELLGHGILSAKDIDQKTDFTKSLDSFFKIILKGSGLNFSGSPKEMAQFLLRWKEFRKRNKDLRANFKLKSLVKKVKSEKGADQTRLYILTELASLVKDKPHKLSSKWAKKLCDQDIVKYVLTMPNRKLPKVLACGRTSALEAVRKLYPGQSILAI